MWLVLGEHDLVLTPGEAAEFDTRVRTGLATSDQNRWSSLPCSHRKANGYTSELVPALLSQKSVPGVTSSPPVGRPPNFDASPTVGALSVTLARSKDGV